jgi:hypothetical protein
MGLHTIRDDVLFSDHAAAYFARADRRVTIGLRAALEMLGLPVPDYAIRRKPGRTPAKDVASAFAADTSIHRDRAYTQDGNRRLAPEGKLPPSRFAAQAAFGSTPRPEIEEVPATLFRDVFGTCADNL